MDLEDDLARLLRAVVVPGPVDDPVPLVHAGMRRRRRAQRLQVLTAAVAVVGVAALGSVVVQRSDGPAPQVPVATPEVTVSPTPPSDPTAVPEGFAVSDLSFVTVEDGWALGTAPCGAARCVVQLVTVDGGRTWVRRPARGLPRSCASYDTGCVTHVRFADDRVGYAYGPGLYVTSDGGKTWSAQPVGSPVAALEVSGGTVVRVLSQCEPACPLVVQTAAVGSFAWRTTHSDTDEAGVELVRQGSRVTLALYGHTAGGAGTAYARLVRSTDDGQTWTQQGDPCATPGAGPDDPDEVDTTALAGGPDGLQVAVCRHRAVDRPTAVRLSTDSGRTFGPAREVPAPRGADSVVPLGGDRVVASVGLSSAGEVAQGLLLSTDAGQTWREVARQPLSREDESTPTFLRFTSPSVGTWVGSDRRTVWRTVDGGESWTAYPFRP